MTPTPTTLTGQINWRIRRPNGDFLERSSMQYFKQDPKQPAILYNRDDDNMLHYEVGRGRGGFPALGGSAGAGAARPQAWPRGRDAAWRCFFLRHGEVLTGAMGSLRLSPGPESVEQGSWEG